MLATQLDAFTDFFVRSGRRGQLRGHAYMQCTGAQKKENVIPMTKRHGIKKQRLGQTLDKVKPKAEVKILQII